MRLLQFFESKQKLHIDLVRPVGAIYSTYIDYIKLFETACKGFLSI